MAEEKSYNVIKTEKGVPIKAWTKGVPLEDQARAQLLNVAQLPFIFKWVAAMPDVHWGIGATVGSVIPTKGAIIPAAVGVDIGCGMMAVQTNLKLCQKASVLGVDHGNLPGSISLSDCASHFRLASFQHSSLRSDLLHCSVKANKKTPAVFRCCHPHDRISGYQVVSIQGGDDYRRKK